MQLQYFTSQWTRRVLQSSLQLPQLNFFIFCCTIATGFSKTADFEQVASSVKISIEVKKWCCKTNSLMGWSSMNACIWHPPLPGEWIHPYVVGAYQYILTPVYWGYTHIVTSRFFDGGGGEASPQYIVGSVKGVKVVESCHCRLGCRWPFVCFMYDDHVIVMEIGYNKPHSCVRYVGFYLSDILIHWYWYQNHLFVSNT